MTLRVQVVLPSSPLRDGAEREAFKAGCRWLAERDVEVLPPAAVAAHTLPWLAGEDGVRAAHFCAAFREGVDVVWMGRGGSGAARTLAVAEMVGIPRIADLLAARRVRLFGFSDGTTLLSAWAMRGWNAWSAPPLTQIARLDDASRERLERGLAGEVPAFAGLVSIVAGQGVGRLMGGNLAVLGSLVGTPQMPSLAGSIVMFEDIGEAAFRVDRLLHQILFAGAFEGVAGVVLGEFSGLSLRDTLEAQVALDDFFGRLGLPCARGLPLGHGTRNVPLPLGWSARLEVGTEATLVLSAGSDGGS